MVESNIEIIGKIDDVLLPPFLFLPFVENCFKHGQLSDGKIFIDMKFKRYDNELEFSIMNSFEQGHLTHDKSGIGHVNINRRLELLYGKEFELKIYRTINSYLVVLKIPLK